MALPLPIIYSAFGAVQSVIAEVTGFICACIATVIAIRRVISIVRTLGKTKKRWSSYGWLGKRR